MCSILVVIGCVCSTMVVIGCLCVVHWLRLAACVYYTVCDWLSVCSRLVVIGCLCVGAMLLGRV